jgi:hypothetical protein
MCQEKLGQDRQVEVNAYFFNEFKAWALTPTQEFIFVFIGLWNVLLLHFGATQPWLFFF